MSNNDDKNTEESLITCTVDVTNRMCVVVHAYNTCGHLIRKKYDNWGKDVLIENMLAARQELIWLVVHNT